MENCMNKSEKSFFSAKTEISFITAAARKFPGCCCKGGYFISQVSFVSRSSLNVWYGFAAFTSSICAWTASL